MKGIVLAGGLGSRLYPLTTTVSKQLLPVYDKPLIYYPISILMLAGIKEILIITTSEHMTSFQKLLGTGERFGVEFSYAKQNSPDGIAQAFIIGENFIGKSQVCLILGDNIFFGNQLSETLLKASRKTSGSTIFSVKVSKPDQFGVIEFDSYGKPIKIEEKPKNPKSNDVVTGLYFFDNNVIQIAKKIKPSPRGELEITDVIAQYLFKKQLTVIPLRRGTAWLDTGNPESLISAGLFIQTIESRQGLKIACLEEIGYRQGWLSIEKILEYANSIKNTTYGEYLYNLKLDKFS